MGEQMGRIRVLTFVVLPGLVQIACGYSGGSGPIMGAGQGPLSDIE